VRGKTWGAEHGKTVSFCAITVDLRSDRKKRVMTGLVPLRENLRCLDAEIDSGGDC
jgi:hypothetical protein